MSVARLAVKYETLAALRARRDALVAAGEPGFVAAELAARQLTCARLAAEFPGALRELEQTPLTTLQARHQALLVVQAGGSAPAWLPLVLDYHAALREVLVLKRQLAAGRRGGPRQPPTPALVAQVQAAALGRPERYAWPLDPAALHAVHAPPGGRLAPLVWAELAARHGGEPASLARLAFGAAATAATATATATATAGATG